MQHCVFCQGELDANSLHCTRCGRAQPIQAAGAAPASAQSLSTQCPTCGAALPAGARFCHTCGARLDEQAGQPKTRITAPTVPRASATPLPLAPAGAPPSSVSVFISYSRTDQEFVARLQADLRAQGIHIWIDHEGIQPGTPDWEEAIRRAIRKARAIVLVASPTSRLSRYVKDELSVAEIYQHPIFPIWAAGNQWIEAIPLGLGHTQYIDARGDVYQAGIRALVETLRVVPLRSQETSGVLHRAGSTGPTFEPRNPYKGLRTFQAEDARDFFGRGKLVADLIEALKTTLDAERADTPGARLLAVAGPSGSGKSSVLLAGLLPRLQQGALPDSKEWVYISPFTPGAHPLESLAVALYGKFPGRDVRTILKDLDEESGRGLHWLASALAQRPGRRVVLLIDQFEELFTLTTNERERKRFLDLLLIAITEARGPVIALLTLRADFYDRLTQYPELARLIKEKHHLVLPMTTEDLRSVIAGPAALSDVLMSFEGPLVGDLLYEVQGQAGALPLLQFTLDQLFQRRDGHVLTEAAYREVGGVRGALTKRAEETFNRLPSDEHRALARPLFLRLISPGATEQDIARRRATLAELTLPDPAQTARLHQVAGDFVAARLLVTNTIAGTTTIEVCHETLIREWPRLAGWLREAREDIYLQQKISAVAAEWVWRGRPADLLYRGGPLVEAQAWAGRSTPSIDEVAFLQASILAQEQQQAAEKEQQARELTLQRRALRRQRYVISLMGVVAIVLIIGLVVGLVLQNRLLATQTSLATSRNALLKSLPVSVTNLSDHGSGSLRQAIEDAKPGDAITFKKDLKGMITLTSGELEIKQNLEISGPGASVLTISGAGKSRIFHVDANVLVTISNMTIEDGFVTCANVNNGLAPCAGGGILSEGSLTLVHVNVLGNSAIDGAGIGLAAFYGSNSLLNISDSTISGNKAAYSGGGIFNFGSDVIINNSTIDDNMAQKAVGGGIFNQQSLTVVNSTVAHNSAFEFGGGIANYEGTSSLTDDTIYANTAGSGGGLFNDNSLLANEPGATTTFILFCTFDDNSVSANGGGIDNNPQYPGTVFILASIVADNHGPQDVYGPTFYLEQGGIVYKSLIETTNGATFIPSNAATTVLITKVSPKLGSLQDNGGPTQTQALMPGSRAIDALAPNSNSDCGGSQLVLGIASTDQRGVSRPQGKGCDLGAYEVQSA